MRHVAWKSIWARKFRLLMTSTAVVIGVAFMAGTLILSTTIDRAFSDLFSDAFENVDAQVRGQEAFTSAQGASTRPPIDESLVTTVSAVPGVERVTGSVDGFAQIVKKDGEPLTTGGAPTFGSVWVDPDDADSKSGFNLTEGTGPRNDNEVVIDRASARRADLKVGDSTTVLVNGPPVQVTISGITRFGTADSPGGTTWVLFTKAAAQRHIGEAGKLTSIEVRAANGISQQQMKERLAAALPSNVEVITGAELTKENEDALKEVTKFLNILLLVFAGIALFVGVIIIYNVFSILVAQRTKENALLRAIGATRRQVTRSVLLEALTVGLIAATLGLVAGIGVAYGIQALLQAFNVKLPTTSLAIPSSAIISSLIVGVTVTMVSAWMPARRASKVPPIAAMRDIAIDTTGRSKPRLVIGSIMLVVGIALMLFGLFSDVDKAYYPVGFGTAVTFLSVVVLGPVLAGPVALVIGALPARFRGVSGKLAQQNARRNPRRTASTAAALMVGVSLVGLMVIFTASVKASVSQTIDKTFFGDYVVQTAGQQFMGGLPPEMTDELNALPQVEAAMGFPFGEAEIAGTAIAITGLDTKRLPELIDIDVEQGSVERMTNNGIAIPDTIAKEHNWQLGSEIPVKFIESEKTFKVESVYKKGDILDSYFITEGAYDEAFPKHLDALVFVVQKDGVTSADARPAIEGVTNKYPNAKLQDNTEFKEDFASQINQILGLFIALLFLSVLIALIGIAITLSLSIHERTREIGLLRAVGMTRRQLRASVRWEAVIVALFGTLMGLVLAIFFGGALVTSLGDEGVEVMSIPFQSLIGIAIIGAIAGVVAALWPAHRASRLNVLRAIANE